MIWLSVHLITFLVQFPWWYKNQFPQKLTFSSIAVCGRILTWSSISGNLNIGLFLMVYISNYHCLPSKTVPQFFEIFDGRLFIAFETWNIACRTHFYHYCWTKHNFEYFVTVSLLFQTIFLPSTYRLWLLR